MSLFLNELTIIGINLRINPFIAAKQNQSNANNLNAANVAALNELTNADESHAKSSNDGETSDDCYDCMDNNQEYTAKNANFLEKYKQIKKIQLEKEAGKTLPTNEPSSPSSQSMPSPKKMFHLNDDSIEDNSVTTELSHSNELNTSNFDNDYFPVTNFATHFGHEENEHDEDNDFDEDYEDDDDENCINDYDTYDFNQFTLNNNTSHEDSQSQTTEITLLKEDNLINGSSSSIDNTIELDSGSLNKKNKRRSEVILLNKSDQIEQQHQKSLSLSNQRTKKKKKSVHTLPMLKRDYSAPTQVT